MNFSTFDLAFVNVCNQLLLTGEPIYAFQFTIDDPNECWLRNKARGLCRASAAAYTLSLLNGLGDIIHWSYPDSREVGVQAGGVWQMYNQLPRAVDRLKNDEPVYLNCYPPNAESPDVVSVQLIPTDESTLMMIADLGEVGVWGDLPLQVFGLSQLFHFICDATNFDAGKCVFRASEIYLTDGFQNAAWKVVGAELDDFKWTRSTGIDCMDEMRNRVRKSIEFQKQIEGGDFNHVAVRGVLGNSVFAEMVEEMARYEP